MHTPFKKVSATGTVQEDAMVPFFKDDGTHVDVVIPAGTTASYTVFYDHLKPGSFYTKIVLDGYAEFGHAVIPGTPMDPLAKVKIL